MRKLHVQLHGVEGGALLTHNERLASKGDEWARKMATISSKRKKSDEDHAELAYLEFMGGLYLTTDERIGIPTWNVWRSIQDGAKLNKLGKAIERALIPAGPDVVPIRHDGPSTPDAAWEAGCYDQRSVKVGTAKVTRTRPLFLGWSVTTEFILNTDIIDLSDFAMAATNAGDMVGLGDYRPRFGRYTVEIEDAD